MILTLLNLSRWVQEERREDVHQHDSSGVAMNSLSSCVWTPTFS